MIKRRRLNPNYRPEHVLEPLEPEPDQWIEDEGEDLSAAAAVEPELAAVEEPALADEPMEALFAELLAEEETAPVPLVAEPEPEPAASIEVAAVPLALAEPLLEPEPEAEPEPLTESVLLPAGAASLLVEAAPELELPTAPLLAAGEAEPAEWSAQLLAEPSEPEDLDLDFSSWQPETQTPPLPQLPALPEMLAVEDPASALLAPEPEFDEGVPQLQAGAAEPAPEALTLDLRTADNMDAVYEALDDIESPEAMDLLAADEPLPDPVEPAFDLSELASNNVDAPLPAAEPPAPKQPSHQERFTLEAEESADPAADFDAPVEAVLSEVAQIIAARGQSLLTRTAKPSEPEPLPPQPSLEEVVSSIEQALESVPAMAPAGPAPVTPHRQFSQLDDYVVFSLSGGDYAIPVRDVAEIGRIPTITRIPNVPDFIRGITNLRGEVVPVLNLPTLLGLQDTHPSLRGRVLFLHGGTRGSATGLVVDEVKGIQRIQSTQLEQVSGLVDDKVTSVLRGVHGRGDRLLNVLDLEQLFAMPEFRQLET